MLKGHSGPRLFFFQISFSNREQAAHFNCFFPLSHRSSWNIFWIGSKPDILISQRFVIYDLEKFWSYTNCVSLMWIRMFLLFHACVLFAFTILGPILGLVFFYLYSSVTKHPEINSDKLYRLNWYFLLVFLFLEGFSTPVWFLNLRIDTKDLHF